MSYRYRRGYYRNSHRNGRNNKSLIELLLYVLILPFMLVYWCIKFIIFLIKKGSHKKDNYNDFSNNFEEEDDDYSERNIKPSLIEYQQKESLVTNYEKYFYDIFEKNFGNKYKIQTQVNLATVVSKTYKTRYQNELYRNIDFGFFDKETLKPLLLIEINDATHKNRERYKRDLKVREILEQAKIKLLTFYSFYDNEEDYVVYRVKKFLSE